MCRKKPRSGSRLAALAGALALAAAATASAEVVEIRSSLTVQERFDTNPLSSSDPEPDWTTELVPSLTARWRGDQGSLAGLMELRGKRHAEFDELDGVDRTLGYDGTYALTPRLSLLSSGRLWHFQQTDELVENAPGRAPVVTFGASPELDGYYWSGSARYALGSRTAVSFTPSVWSNDYAEPDDAFTEARTDSRSLGGALKLERNLSAYDTLYAELARTTSEFSGGSVPDSDSRAWELETGWTRSFGDLWESTLSLGLNRLESNEAEQAYLLVDPNAPGAQGGIFIQSPDDTAVTGVGALSLTRRARRTTFSLALSQQVSPTSGYGSDVTIRSARSSLSWYLNRRWTFDVIGDWSRSKSTAEGVVPTLGLSYDLATYPETGCPPGQVPVFASSGSFVFPACLFEADSEGFDVTQLGLYGALNWQMSKRFSTFLRYRFTKRTSSGDLALGEYDNNAFWLGFTYRYDVDLY